MAPDVSFLNAVTHLLELHQEVPEKQWVKLESI